MKAEVYNSILEDYKVFKKEYGMNAMERILKLLIDKYAAYGVGDGTIHSLIHYEYRKNDVLETGSKVASIDWDKVCQDYDQGESIINIATKFNIPAFTVLKQIALKSYNREQIKSFMKDSSLCPLVPLSYDIMKMNASDIMNGAFHNQLNLASGTSFEKHVQAFLEENKVTFLNESQMRSRRYDITPDFLLNIPLVLLRRKNSMVLCRCDDGDLPEPTMDEVDRCIITWIECKALFASVECHMEYYETQYSSYVNLLGNGLVLYKYGFVEPLPSSCTKNVVLANQMPPILSSKRLIQ